jgi:hypothetical protein
MFLERLFPHYYKNLVETGFKKTLTDSYQTLVVSHIHKVVCF